MKKLFILLTVFVLLFATGCGKNISELNVDKTKEIIETELKDMEPIDEEELKDVYGLSLDLMEVHVMKMNSNYDLYAIIKTNDKTKVKGEMTKYFEKVQKFNANYSPERIELINNRVEKEIGDYLIYIVSDNANDIYNKIIKSM